VRIELSSLPAYLLASVPAAILVDPTPASSEKLTPIGTASRQDILLRCAFCAGLAALLRRLALLISDLLQNAETAAVREQARRQYRVGT
jgi:hypothetical protein